MASIDVPRGEAWRAAPAERLQPVVRFGSLGHQSAVLKRLTP
ncbi:hypothetical protein [Acuticoccus sp.]